MRDFDTSELFQAYLTGLEDGRSVPLDQLAEPPAWVQGRLLADRDPRRMSARDMARRPDLGDFETRVYGQEIASVWKPISASFASIAAQQSADLSRLLQGISGRDHLNAMIAQCIVPTQHFEEYTRLAIQGSFGGYRLPDFRHLGI